MLSAFFETFFITLGIFVLLEIALRMSNIGKQFEQQEDEHQQLLDQLENAIVLCKVEQLNDVFYLYNSHDESFVGQARNIEEFTQLSERLQKHLMIVDGNEDVIAELKRLTSETSFSQ